MVGSGKRGPREYAPSRNVSRITTQGINEYGERLAPAVEGDAYHSQRGSVTTGFGGSHDNELGDDAFDGDGPNDRSIDGEDPALLKLFEIETGFPLLLDRVKQSIQSTKEAAAFLKKRAAIEDEYGKAMLKLGQSVAAGTRTDGKEGSFGEAWSQFVNIHERIGENRIKLSTQVAEAAEELVALQKDTERSRKQLKESTHSKWKMVQEAENCLEKAKVRYEATSEDWERAVQSREGANPRNDFSKSPSFGSFSGVGLHKSGSTRTLGSIVSNPMARFKAQTPAKRELDARNRAATCNDEYKQQLQKTNQIRGVFRNEHRLQFIRSLKQSTDECDDGLKHHLNTYATAYCNNLYSEGQTIAPLKDDVHVGLVETIASIDNEGDFDAYAEAYVRLNGFDARKGDALMLSRAATTEALSTRPSFGVPLKDLMERDGVAVPHAVRKCIEFVEKYGMAVQGIYRVSGPSATVQKIRAMLERDAEHADLMCALSVHDLHSVCGALKLFFRELADPLFPRDIYPQLLEAAQLEDEKKRLISIHELINTMHDANYATLAALAGHLHRITAHEETTKMSTSNLSIIWGPTLLDAPTSPSAEHPNPDHIKLQTRIVEVVASNYADIFDEEEEYLVGEE
ncbi:hypothetical protein HKX48_001379 [Thoreauomyces humboldtii]|nr:hypothetical protein HKX48_001379 [Thoreauomyces humboldtii]